MNLAGHEFEDRELLRRALRNMRGVQNPVYGEDRWVKVMRVFGVGSTVARALCLELGFSPDSRVAK